jgi:hypothetical protein
MHALHNRTVCGTDTGGESRNAGPRGAAGAGGRARTDATGALQCQASGILEELCRSGGSMGGLIKQTRHDEESRN